MNDDVHRPRTVADADILRWQIHVRTVVALGVGCAALLFRREDGLLGGSSLLLVLVVGYITTTVLLTLAADRRERAVPWAVAITIVADLALVFGATLALSAPAYHDRALILSLLVLFVAESYFGPQAAWLALVAALAAHVGEVTLAASRGVAWPGGGVLSWTEELLSTALFALIGAIFILRYGSARRRLNRIVALFERAEEGDFSGEYDAERDRHPDSITLVGRAYNRVRSQLASMVLTDPLTGCLNRRGFDQALAREVARCARAGSDLSLLALDLDHFKLVNDTRGHLAGDAVLREAGVLLRQTARQGDIVARVGGEEFAILLSDTGASGAFQFATRLCDRVRGHVFTASDRPIHVTVSIGVVSGALEKTRPIDEQVQELKLHADDALYAAKRSGRDRVRVWTAQINPRRSGELTADTLAEIQRRG